MAARLPKLSTGEFRVYVRDVLRLQPPGERYTVDTTKRARFSSSGRTATSSAPCGSQTHRPGAIAPGTGGPRCALTCTSTLRLRRPLRPRRGGAEGPRSRALGAGDRRPRHRQRRRGGAPGGREERIEVVPAVEINAYHGAFEYHILGYFLDHRDERLGRASGAARGADRPDAPHRRSSARSGWRSIPKRSLPRPAAAPSEGPHRPRDAPEALRLLDARGVRPLHRESPPTPRARNSPRGGDRPHPGGQRRPVLAHRASGATSSSAAGGRGIAGIEVYTPDHTGAQRERYRGFARDLGLIQTGGSDYHGWKDNSGNTLGAAATPRGVQGASRDSPAPPGSGRTPD